MLAVCSHVLSVSTSFFPTFNSLHMLELVVSVFVLSLIHSSVFSFFSTFICVFFFFSFSFSSFYFWTHGNAMLFLLLFLLVLPDYLPQVRVTRTIELETFLFVSGILRFHVCVLSSWHARERVYLIVNVNKVKILE